MKFKQILDAHFELVERVFTDIRLPLALTAVQKNQVSARYIRLMKFALQALLKRELASLSEGERNYVALINHLACQEMFEGEADLAKRITDEFEAYSVIAFRSVMPSNIVFRAGQAASEQLNTLIAREGDMLSSHLFGALPTEHLRRVNAEILGIEGVENIFEVVPLAGVLAQGVGRDELAVAWDLSSIIVRMSPEDRAEESSDPFYFHVEGGSIFSGRDNVAVLLCIGLLACFPFLAAVGLRAFQNLVQTVIHPERESIIRLLPVLVTAFSALEAGKAIQSSELSQQQKILADIVLGLAALLFYVAFYSGLERAASACLEPPLRIKRPTVEAMIRLLHSSSLFDIEAEYSKAVQTVLAAEPSKGFPRSLSAEWNRTSTVLGRNLEVNYAERKALDDLRRLRRGERPLLTDAIDVILEPLMPSRS